MTGMQRLQQIETKVRIIAARELRQYMAGEIPFLSCSGDRLRLEIAREFDSLGRERDGQGQA
jgi:hypothetical protein